MGRGDSPDIKQFFKKRGRVLNFISPLNPLIDLNIGNNVSCLKKILDRLMINQEYFKYPYSKRKISNGSFFFVCMFLRPKLYGVFSRRCNLILVYFRLA